MDNPELTGPLLRAAGEVVDAYMVRHETPAPKPVKTKPVEENPYARKRTQAQREADLLLIDRMANKQMIPLTEVTEHINSIRPYKLSYHQIHHDHRELIARFRERMGSKLVDYKLRELDTLEKLEREAYEAWERSKEDKIGVTQISEPVRLPGRAGAGTPTLEVSRRVNTKEKSNGDPRYLQVILSIKERKAKLCGLDAPLKLEVDAKTETNMLSFNSLKEAFTRRVLREHGVSPVIDIPAKEA